MTTRTNRGWDYKRALAELWGRSSYERGLISDPFGDSARAERGLARMRRLLAALGDPHRNLPAVHIAGSKGKGRPAPSSPRPRSRRVTVLGSTRPRICTDFPERLSIDGQPLSDDAFAAETRAVATAARRLESSEPDVGQVTTFELLTAMAFNTFARQVANLRSSRLASVAATTQPT